MQSQQNLLDTYRGCLLGLATGDALGTTLESQAPPQQLHTEIIGGGPYDVHAGCWTDGIQRKKVKLTFTRYIHDCVSCGELDRVPGILCT